MKILHILTDSNIGGAGIYLLNLLKSYDRDALTMEVVLPADSRLIPSVKALDVPVIEAPHIQDQSFSLKAVHTICHLFKERKPDLVNTHAAFSGRIAAKLLGIPVVHTRHYCISSFSFKQKLLGHISNFFSTMVIATSPEVADGLIKTGTNPFSIVTIFNGVPPVQTLSPEEKAAIRMQYGISDTAFVVSQVARLDPVKGHDHTLDAAKLLADDPDIVILLAGDGPYENHLRRRIDEESIKNVILTGFVEAVERIFNITDLQINASFTETTCLALLEGMSLGLPSVATDGGGNPYVIAHESNGLLVPCGNGEALAQAVLKIKNDSGLYQQFSKGAAKSYHMQFTAEAMAHMIETLYRSVGTVWKEG
ncbi:MAG: glycosyltransferase family 4 protein [Defluviitaleaceae bacterium]|nr:glycosyltransferase family 4 protein [Defluviitaleaceae bacterium]